MAEFDPTRYTANVDELWSIDGISDEAVTWAESEAARRELTLAEWVEEVIERALVQEKAGGNGPTPGADRV